MEVGKMDSIFRDESKKLGFGLMRLPQADPNDWQSPILVEQVKEMVDCFMEQGFTYLTRHGCIAALTARRL